MQLATIGGISAFVFFGAKFWNFNASIGEIFAAAFAGALQAIQTVTAEKITDKI